MCRNLRPLLPLLVLVVALGAHAQPAAEINVDMAHRTRVYVASNTGQPVRLNLDLPFLLGTRWTIGTPADAFRLEERLSAVPGGIAAVQFRLVPGAVAGEEIREHLGGSTIRPDVRAPRTFLGQPALPEEVLDGDAIGRSAAYEYGDERGTVRVASRTLARGWIETPAGPFIASLRREEVFRDGPSGSELQEVRLRWVSARIGTVALARIVAGAERSAGVGAIPEVGRTVVDSLAVLADAPPEAFAGMRVYHQELAVTNLDRYFVGWDKGNGTTVDSLTPDPTPTMGDLLALDYWDFSGNTTGTPIITTNAAVDSSETCNTAQCGYSNSAKAESMTRDDRTPATQPNRTNSIYWDDGDDGPGGTPLDPAKITNWVIAGAEHEGVSDFFSANGEGRFCFDPDAGRTPVPSTVWGHRDAQGYYLTAGDTWQSAVFNCDQNTYDTTCGVDDNLLDDGLLHSGACQSGSQAFPGRFENDVVKAGTVKLPSGHTINTILLRTRASFCSYFTASSCRQQGSGTDQTNQYVVLWSAPWLDAVVRLDSPRKVTGSAGSYTTLVLTQIGIGLLPPLSIEVTGAPSGRVQISWNPGGGTPYIDRYKVYWGTSSGNYPFNSDTHPGQASIVGTTATISGLTDGVPHYFTVTSLDNYANPGRAGGPPRPSREYESALFPRLLTGDPDFSYPAEVAAAPGLGCIPDAEVRNLRVSKSGGTLQFCWDPAAGSCVQGYELLGSNDATSAAGWSPVADPGPATCVPANPDRLFFLVVADGPGGTGPWGHYD